LLSAGDKERQNTLKKDEIRPVLQLYPESLDLEMDEALCQKVAEHKHWYTPLRGGVAHLCLF
jgi:hypothetical protein